jgi:hypothetical protein
MVSESKGCTYTQKKQEGENFLNIEIRVDKIGSACI